jgi:hypothetical protein
MRIYQFRLLNKVLVFTINLDKIQSISSAYPKKLVVGLRVFLILLAVGSDHARDAIA